MNTTQQDILKIQTQIGNLRKVCLGLTALALLGCGLTYGLISTARAQPHSVLRAERVELVEPDGQLAFVMGNSQRPGAVYLDGKKLVSDSAQRRQGNTSTIFYDGKGDEVGGFIFGTDDPEKDEVYATRQFTLDAYRQDQTVVLRHFQSKKGSFAGLLVNDRGSIPMTRTFDILGLEQGKVSMAEYRKARENAPPEQAKALEAATVWAQRGLLGSRHGQAMLRLQDGKGNPRFAVSVPEKGPVSIKVWDEKGQEQGLASLLKPVPDSKPQAQVTAR